MSGTYPEGREYIKRRVRGGGLHGAAAGASEASNIDADGEHRAVESGRLLFVRLSVGRVGECSVFVMTGGRTDGTGRFVVAPAGACAACVKEREGVGWTRAGAEDDDGASEV